MYKILQKSQFTKYDRYPLTFSFLASTTPKPLRILSFGCSTGAELQTLKQKYFPSATIEGCDIDLHCLLKAKSKGFNCFPPDKLSEQMNYDLIIANSVLCQWNSTDEPLQTPISFEDFSTTCKLLDSKLNGKGILCTINSNYYVDAALNNYIEITLDPTLFLEIEKVSVFSPKGEYLGKNRRVVWQKIL